MGSHDLSSFADARPIPGHADYYATADGEIVSTVHGQPRIRRKVMCRGRYFVGIRRVRCVVGTLVCSAFHGAKPSPAHVAIHRNDLLDDRPENLYWGTVSDTIAHNVARGQQAHGERHGRHKLTDDEVRQIKTRLLQGARDVELAAMFRVTRGCIGFIAAGLTWKHISIMGTGTGNRAQGEPATPAGSSGLQNTQASTIVDAHE
jgi:hypothetical protein